jgi:S-adenosylmethionine hydrolase
MAIVTLLTDSGESDFYVAAIKARILSVNPGLTLVDISHRIAPCDIAHGAYVLRSVFHDFPRGTVHLVGVDATGNKGEAFLAVSMEEHFFIGVDNGLFGLISDKAATTVVELNKINPVSTTFPERDVFAPAAAKLASGVNITSLGTTVPQFRKSMDRQVKATKRMIAGHVVRVDNYGNLLTNIHKDAFDTLSKGKSFTVQFGGERAKKLQTYYNQVDQGECFLLFNSTGVLEIGIYKGNAAQLLGMGYDSPVNILFEE